MENDGDVIGRDACASQVVNDRLVEAPFSGCRSAWIRGDLDERVALTCSMRNLEVLWIMFDEPLSAIILWYAECFDEGGRNLLEEPLSLGDRLSLENLDSH